MATTVVGQATGTIEVVGDNDWFRVQLSAGTQYVFDVGGGTLGNPQVSLYDASGTLITSATDGGPAGGARISVEPATTGIYYIGASSTLSTTGTFTVTESTAPFDFAGNTGTAGLVAVGGQASGNISVAGQNDWYKVQLTAGTEYVLSIGNGTLAFPLVTLYDSAGHYVISGNDGDTLDGTTTVFTPTTSGTYYVGASGLVSSTGTFTVSVATATPDFAGNTTTTGTVAVGGQVSGTIANVGQHDWFKVHLVAGTEYVFDEVGGTLSAPAVSLYDGSGNLIVTGYNGVTNGARISYEPTTTADYYVGASSFMSTTGTFTVSVAAAAFDFAGNTSTTGTVAVGGTAIGNITTVGQHDWFKVTLQAGTQYVFDAGAGTLTNAQVALYDGSGALLAQGSGGGASGGARTSFEPTSSGSYYVSASGSNGATGTFTVAVSTASFDFAGNATTAGAVSAGSPATGTIGVVAQNDWFRTTLQAGTQYVFDLGAGTLAAPVVSVYDSTGHLLSQGNGGAANGGAETSFTPTVSGTYYVGAAGAGAGTGTFTLSMATATDDYTANVGTTGQIGPAPLSVATAIANFQHGQLTQATPVSDTAANVQANLSGLETVAAGGRLGSIALTDSATPTLSITAAQLAADAPVLRDIFGAYNLSLSGAAGVAGVLTQPQLLSVAVSDSAANISANLDGLQAVAAAGKLGAVTLTDGGTPTVTLSASQFTADAAALAQISGNYHVTVTGIAVANAAGTLAQGGVTAVGVTDSAANVQAALDALQGLATAGSLASITLSDAGTPTLNASAVQVTQDAGAFARMAGSYTLAVTDSALDVQSSLDALQAMAASGKLTSITLNDGGTPVLSVTSTQLVSDAQAINAITGSYVLNAPGVATSVATFVVQQESTGRGANGIALVYPGTAPAGANSVVGFQNATFTSGQNAVVLDGPKSSYAIQVNASGVTTIQDIGAGDATFGQTVTVSGESYILFNGAHIAISDPASVAALTVPPGSTAPVLNYPNDLYFVLTPANAQLAQFYSSLLPWEPQPALSGYEYWANRLAGGMSLISIAQSFINTTYFQQTYGDPGTTSAQHVAFVQLLYSHILGMNLGATNAGVQYWAGQMDSNPLMDGAHALVSFTNATATAATINAISGTAAGAGTGWLIDPSLTGGYADPGMQIAAQTVLTQSTSSGFLNLSLVDPATVGSGGVSANGITLTPNTVQIGATVTSGTVILSPSFTQATIAGSGVSLHDGPGTDTINVSGNANVVTIGSATTDTLNLSSGTASTIVGFVPGQGSILAVSGTVNQTGVSLLNGTTTPVQGGGLIFGTAGAATAIVVNIGNIGGGSAAEVATAANRAYVVADVNGDATTGALGEHVIFIGTTSGGDTEIFAFQGPLSTVTLNGQALHVPITGADTSGTHSVTTTEITLIATVLGVSATNLTMGDLL